MRRQFNKQKPIAIKRDEWQFREVKHTYLIARAMYYLLRVNDRLSSEDNGAIVRLVYYCLLRNYLENKDVLSTDIKYADLISGCELAFVVMCKTLGNQKLKKFLKLNGLYV